MLRENRGYQKRRLEKSTLFPKNPRDLFRAPSSLLHEAQQNTVLQQLLQSSLPYFPNEQALPPRKIVWDIHNLGNNCILAKLFPNYRNNRLNLTDSSITPRGCFPLIYVLLPLGLSFSHPLSYLQTLKLFMSLRLLHKEFVKWSLTDSQPKPVLLQFNSVFPNTLNNIWSSSSYHLHFPN